MQIASIYIASNHPMTKSNNDLVDYLGTGPLERGCQHSLEFRPRLVCELYISRRSSDWITLGDDLQAPVNASHRPLTIL
jgi:hypothetical protein